MDIFLAKPQVNDIEVENLVLAGGSSGYMVQNMLEKKFKIKPKCDVNVDEIVAHGAAIAEMMTGNSVKDVMDAPLKLGADTLGSIFDCIIEDNTTIPVATKKAIQP